MDMNTQHRHGHAAQKWTFITNMDMWHQNVHAALTWTWTYSRVLDIDIEKDIKTEIDMDIDKDMDMDKDIDMDISTGTSSLIVPLVCNCGAFIIIITICIVYAHKTTTRSKVVKSLPFFSFIFSRFSNQPAEGRAEAKRCQWSGPPREPP
jgi:hypothetical protein